MIAIQPTWDLSDLYQGLSDPKINFEIEKGRKKARTFGKKYKGKLAKLCRAPKTVLKILHEYEDIFVVALKPMEYAQLIFAESSSDAIRGSFQQRMKSEFIATRNEVLFFELEILALPVATLKKLVQAPLLLPYKNYLRKLLLSKPHRLPEKEERILDEKSLTGRSALVRLFDEELALKKFAFTFAGTKKELSETEVLNLLYSAERDKREAAAESLSQGLNEEARRLTFITNTLSEDKSIDDKFRGFKTPEASRHLANEISQEMVDSMSRVVTSRYDLVQRYYKFKAKVLGEKILFDYDRYAPVGASTTVIPFDEARALVLDAFHSFSPDYGKIAEEFFVKNWVDAADRPGKRGGAFCSYATPDLHPYVFMNYHGSMRDVFTLAHELGHAIHGYLMRDRGLLNADTPLTIAETASVFAEALLFQRLKSVLKDPAELFALTMGRIENSFATVFRQISMYRFEQDLHSERARTGELSTERINELWMGRQREMFGRSIILSKGYEIWWSYIPHFLHTPFYVYAYSFGELMTLSLFARYQEMGAPFVNKYLGLLSAGGSKSPEELVRPLGINLKSESFWRGGIDIIESMVRDAEALHSA